MLLENGSRIQVVSGLTLLATVNGQLTALCRSELAGLVYADLTDRTPKAIGMEMFNDPLCTVFFVE